MLAIAWHFCPYGHILVIHPCYVLFISYYLLFETPPVVVVVVVSFFLLGHEHLTQRRRDVVPFPVVSALDDISL